MFSKFELAIIELDISHVLKTVSLDVKQKKTRESIVEKISSHNKQSKSASQIAAEMEEVAQRQIVCNKPIAGNTLYRWARQLSTL